MRAARQTLQQLPSVRSVEIQRHAAFIIGVSPPKEAFFGMRLALVEGADMPRRAAAGRLDLDDVGAEIGEDFAAQQASLIGEVEDAIRAEEKIRLRSGHGWSPGW